MSFARLFENFENVDVEECKLIGEVPPWLKGTMVRNGPGMFKIGDTEYRHWFDGMAYIQRYHFVDRKMYYSARYLESDDYKANMRANRIIAGSFGTRTFPDPCKTLFQRLTSFFQPDKSIDNCSVAFTQLGDAVYAVTESPLMVRIDTDNLDNLGQVDIRKHLKVSLHTYSAHSHSDADGNLYNIGSMFGGSSKYVFAKTNAPKKGETNDDFENTELLGMVAAADPWAPAYYHSFGITDNYIVLFECPERLNLKKIIVQKFIGSSYNECMYYDPSLQVNVILFDRINRKRVERKITSDAFFTFHHANAYEKDGFIVVDYCKLLNPGNFDDFILEHIRLGSLISKDTKVIPYLHRMIIPTNVSEDSKPGDDLLSSCKFAKDCKAILKEDGSIHCTDMKMCELSFEFPRYCYDLNMKEYRYVYGANLGFDSEAKQGVVKVDLVDGTNKVWYKDAADQLCAEPILVNKPNYSKEDEGVLLVPVITTNENDTPYVAILNAESLEEQARFVIPQSRIPLGFHAHYVSKPNL